MTPEQKRDKIRSTDRVAVLEVMDGEKPLSSMGLTDPRLFTGENRLHIVKDTQRNIWAFKYEQGGVPEPLKQKFTDFGRALKHAQDYYKTRNIKIVDVID